MKKKEIDILFVIPPYHKRNGSGSLFPLGISAIMACLEEKQYSFDYINCPDIIDTLYPEALQQLEGQLSEMLKNYNPILVGIGPCVTPGVKGLEIVAKCCIETFGNERIFAGGPFTMLQSQDWFFYEHLGLLYTIKGDGEEAVCKAIETMKEGKELKQCNTVSIPGNSHINILHNLDEMPFPKRIEMEKNRFSDRRKSESTMVKTAHIVTSRGCPYRCDYCVSGNINIPFRKRSPKNIAEEMKMLSDQFGVSDIVFYDDCFFTSARNLHSEVEQFCAILDKYDLHMTWQIEMRPDILMELNDTELRKLSRNGCRQMNIGVEKTYDDGASIFGKQYDYIKLKDYLAHAHSVAPIRMTGTFILGGKEETQASVSKLISASADMNLDEAEYSPLFVYPETPIYKDVFADPRSWLDLVLSSEEPWGEVVYENNELSKDMLIALVDKAYSYFNQERLKTDRVRDRYRLKGKNQ